VAFLVGRLTTGRYGYSVPGGLLVALGAYVSLQAAQTTPRPIQSGGWFFVLLGAGFVVVYVAGLRPARVWPLFPATLLVGLGLVLFGFTVLSPLASLAWIVAYWPVALVLLGLWQLFHQHLPAQIRGPLAVLGGVGLLIYGLVAAAASVANAGALARTGLEPAFGPSPFADTVSLAPPLHAGQTLHIENSSGRTTVRSAGVDGVSVTAARRFSLAGQGPEVHLTPVEDGLSLTAAPAARRGPFGFTSGSVDYQVDVPAGVSVQVRSSSGAIDASGISGQVQAETDSGQIVLTDIAGDTRAVTHSGQIRGTQLRHVQQVQSDSGSVSLESVFAAAGSVRTSSGGVQLKMLPGSAIGLDVRTGSGSIRVQGLAVADQQVERTRLTGSVGTPAAASVLQVETSSGSVTLSQ
jgi:hypothetical protein